MIKASIIGATGYAGEQLARILFRHPEVDVVALASKSYAGQKYSDVYPNFRKITDQVLVEPDLKKLSEQSDVVFLALPAGIAAKEVDEEILAQSVVIDLGADFRLHDTNIYSKWYKLEHPREDINAQAVYGMPELHRDEIRGKRLIANPGCYTTASILSLAPLYAAGVIDPDSVVIDAGSGVTGAGRSVIQSNMFCEVDESMKAYKVASHRHTPEIEQELGLLYGEDVVLNFTPHLIPMNRGILATSYLKLKDPDMTQEDIEKLYQDFYQDEYFVRLLGSTQPETKYVKDSNFIDIGVVVDSRTGRVIVTSALDNLMKGAAGQAVQNMNLVFGLLETCGIDFIPDFPV